MNRLGPESRYGYDPENRLTSASVYGGTTLTYDPLGRLWSLANPVFGKTQFVYDQGQVAVEYDGDTLGIHRRFFWGPRIDEPKPSRLPGTAIDYAETLRACEHAELCPAEIGSQTG